MTALTERIIPSGHCFVGAVTGLEARLWGANYDGGVTVGDGGTLHDIWGPAGDRATITEDMDQFTQNLGCNAFRTLLDMPRMMSDAGTVIQSELDNLAWYLGECDARGIYVIICGLNARVATSRPSWWLAQTEAQRWQTQAIWWYAVAATAASFHCPLYDVMNEPGLPTDFPTTAQITAGATTIPLGEVGGHSSGGGTALVGGPVPGSGDKITYTGKSASSGAGNLTGVTGVTKTWASGTRVTNNAEWVGGALGSYSYVQFVSLWTVGRNREDVAADWYSQMRDAILKGDPAASLTLGALPSIDETPQHNVGYPFANNQPIGALQDFHSAHLYPEALGTQARTNKETVLARYVAAADAADVPFMIAETFFLASGYGDLNSFVILAGNRAVGFFTQWQGQTWAEETADGYAHDPLGLWALSMYDTFVKMQFWGKPTVPVRAIVPSGRPVVTDQWNARDVANPAAPVADTRLVLCGNVIDEGQPSWDYAPDLRLSAFAASSVLEFRLSSFPLKPGTTITGGRVHYRASTPLEAVMLDPDGTTIYKNQFTINGGQATNWQTVAFGLSGGTRDPDGVDEAKYMSVAADNLWDGYSVGGYSLSGRTVTGARIHCLAEGGTNIAMNVQLRGSGSTIWQTWSDGIPAAGAKQWRTFTYTGALTQQQVTDLNIAFQSHTTGTPGTAKLYRAYAEIILDDASTTLLQVDFKDSASNVRVSDTLGTNQAMAWHSFEFGSAVSQAELDDLRLRFTIPSGAKIAAGSVVLDAAYVDLYMLEEQVLAPTGIAPPSLPVPAPTVAVPGGMWTLQDDFNDGVVDAALWPVRLRTGSPVEAGGEMRLAATVAGTSVSTAGFYDLRGQEVWTRVSTDPTALDGFETFSIAAPSGLASAMITRSLDGIQAIFWEPDGTVRQSSWKGVMDRYLAFREYQGNLIAMSSVDGRSWTSRGKVGPNGTPADPTQSWASAVRITLGAATFVGPGGYAGFDFVGAYSQTVRPGGGIASGEDFGDVTVSGPQGLTGAGGIVSRAAVGRPLLTGAGFINPAIDSGDPAWMPPTDIVGTSRPQGSLPDRGAWEFFVPPPLTVRPAGLGSGAAFGRPTIVRQGTVRPVGVASAGAFGTASLSSPTGVKTVVQYGSILTAESFSVPLLQRYAPPLPDTLGRPQWRFILCELNGTQIAELTGVAARVVTIPLNGVPTVTFTLPTTHRYADRLLAGDVLLKAYRTAIRGGAPVLTFIGEASGAQEDSQSQGGLIGVTFSGPFWRLLRRHVGIASDAQGKGIGWTAGTLASPLPTTTLAWYAIKVLNTDFFTGIDLGSISPSAAAYAGPYYMKKAGELIAELAVAAPGFDFEVAPVEPVGTWPDTRLGLFNAAPVLGAVRPDVWFEYGTGKRNLAKYGRVMDKSGKANVVWSLSPGWPDAPQYGQPPDGNYDAASILGTGRFEDVLTGDLPTPELRRQLAAEHVRVRSAPRNQFSIEPVPNALPDYGTSGGDYRIGDIIGVRAFVDGEWRFNGQVRVYQATFTIDEDGTEHLALALIPGAQA